MTQLHTEQESLIKQHLLKAINDENMPLPKNLEINKIYKTVYYKYGNRGCRDLTFIIKLDSNNKIMVDFFIKTDDYSSHKRMDEFGNSMDLENYEGQFGWPVFENKEDTDSEHTRIKLHNQYVYEILKQKGFEK